MEGPADVTIVAAMTIVNLCFCSFFTLFVCAARVTVASFLHVRASTVDVCIKACFVMDLSYAIRA